MARPGHERFTEPTLAAQRRYEALRAYFVEELSPGEIAERLGYTKASVQTLISTYRAGDLGGLFAQSRPGPKRQPKKDAARELAIRLRRERHGIEEIVSELERAGTPLSRTAVWEILRDDGLSRIPKPPRAPEPPPAPERLHAAKVHVLEQSEWPSEGSIQTAHAACSCSSRSWQRWISPGWSRRLVAVHQPASRDPLGAIAARAQALR